MPRSLRLLPALALGASLGLVAGRAVASPEDVFGFGARSSALGATGPASAEGYEAVYGNPALLSLARDRQLTLGLTTAVFDVHAGGSRLAYEPLRGSVIGAVLPVPFGGVLKDRIALGFGFYTPFDLIVRGRILYPEKIQYPLADRTQSVAVQAGIGVDLSHGVRLGGGFAALAALSGTVLVATDASGRIGTTVDDTLVASYGPILGASVDLGDSWRVGLTFRGVLQGRFNVVITVRDLGSITVPPLNISGVAQYDPWQLALEVARVRGPWKLAAGLTYKHWSAYPGLPEPTVRCVDASGMAVPDCGALVPAPPGYHDTVSPHVGVERAFAPGGNVDAFARAGFFFEPSPAPAGLSAGYVMPAPPTGVSNAFDNHRAAFTLGYGVEVGPKAARVALDMFGQAQVLVPRDHHRDATVPAGTPGLPSFSSSGVIGAFGATAGVKF